MLASDVVILKMIAAQVSYEDAAENAVDGQRFELIAFTKPQQAVSISKQVRRRKYSEVEQRIIA